LQRGKTRRVPNDQDERWQSGEKQTQIAYCQINDKFKAENNLLALGRKMKQCTNTCKITRSNFAGNDKQEKEVEIQVK